jgi:hypothetical protein
VGEHLIATALTDDPRILPALLVSAGAGQRYQALSVLARALATPSIAADLRDRLGEQLRDVITMGVEGAALTGIRGPGNGADLTGWRLVSLSAGGSAAVGRWGNRCGNPA